MIYSLSVGMFFLILLLNFSAAEQQTLGTFQVDEDITLVQGCLTSTYSNITNILYPNSTFAISGEIGMTQSSNDNYYYLFNLGTEIGEYVVYGHCNEGGVDTQWVYNFYVTSTGQKVSLSNSIIVIVFLLMAGVFLFLGWSFSTQHWILKTFFNFSAVGMGILAVNSAKIIASESSNLGVMGTTGLTLMIVVFALFFLYMFVYSFIEVIKSFREKRGVRWNYD